MVYIVAKSILQKREVNKSHDFRMLFDFLLYAKPPAKQAVEAHYAGGSNISQAAYMMLSGGTKTLLLIGAKL